MEKIKKNNALPIAGDLLAIPIKGGNYCYAGLTSFGDCVFFDLMTQELDKNPNLKEEKILFRVYVDLRSIKKSKWEVIGHWGCGDNIGPARYRNQPVGSNQLFIYINGNLEEAELDAVSDLELFVVWMPIHVEQRLDDYYNGRANAAVEFFKKIKKYDINTGQEIP
ncbi:hypothetical protein [Pseudomonas sp. dw_358]|uniref:hypothetical protein n=1 Tax=Pseudomonas sp. dw_358 TaxID=2720083 RepID=UPI001BD6075C|nr:hypothetical protein [Pseudomonas sp. dw_358]